MNARHTFAPADDLLNLAYAVLAGDYDGLPRIIESELYDLDQWRREAISTTLGDGRDFARMIERETEHQFFRADIRHGRISEDDCFDDYVAMAPRRVTWGMGL